MWYSFYATLETTQNIARVNLVRDLSKEFMGDELFTRIMVSIVDCEVLYDKHGGKYGFAEINKYLGILDDVSFFYSSGALDYNTVNHHFGGVIVEAYVYKEVQDYIAELRTKAGEEGALEDFESLAKKIALHPQRKKQVELYTRDCTNQVTKE